MSRRRPALPVSSRWNETQVISNSPPANLPTSSCAGQRYFAPYCASAAAPILHTPLHPTAAPDPVRRLRHHVSSRLSPLRRPSERSAEISERLRAGLRHWTEKSLELCAELIGSAALSESTWEAYCGYMEMSMMLISVKTLSATYDGL
jgi:hypothetical protein